MSARWEDIVEGSEPEALVFGPITLTDVVRYQGASGDMNPIHHDVPFATAAGYPAPLVVGMLPAGVMNTWAADWLGPENIRSTKVRWKQQVWPGDTLTCRGKLLRKYEDGGERRVDVEVGCTNQDDVVTSQVWVTFVVPD